MKRSSINKRLIEVGIIFLFSVLIRFIISDFSRIISIYPDELRYVGIAKSLINGRGLKIGALETDYQKIFYSLLIAPSYLFKTASAQNTAIALMNSVYMSLSIFPIYCLCRDMNLSRKSVIGIETLFLVFSDMVYTSTFMSEVVYMPLLLLCIYATYRLFIMQYSTSKIYLAICVGGMYYLLYFCKEISLGMLLAYVIVETFFTIAQRDKWREQMRIALLVLSSFLFLFVFLKLVFFRGMGNSYNQMGISAILQPYNFLYLFYGAFYYFICLIIALGVFPMLFPVLCYKEYDRSTKKFIAFLLFMVIIEIGVIAYTITVREDLGKVAPRMHMRYMYPLLFPFLIVTLIKVEKKIKVKELLYALAILSILILFVFQGIGEGPVIDQTPLKYISTFLKEHSYLLGAETALPIDIGALILKGAIIFILFVIGASFCFYKEKAKGIVVAVLTMINLLNTHICINEYQNVYSIDKSEEGEMEYINEFISNLDEEILFIVSNNSKTWGKIDTYIVSRDAIVVYANTLETIMGEEAYIDLNENKLIGKFPYEPYDNLNTVGYIIVEKGVMTFKEGTVEVIDADRVENFVIYKNLIADRIYCRDRLPKEVGECSTIRGEDKDFYSCYEIKDGQYISGSEANFLIYGPYLPLDAGEYHLKITYECEDHTEKSDVIGYSDVNLNGTEVYVSELMYAGERDVELNFTLLNDCPNIEFRIWAAEEGIMFKELQITKLK